MEQKFSDNMHISIYLNLFMGRPVNARRKQKPETYTVSSIKMTKTCNGPSYRPISKGTHFNIFYYRPYVDLVGWLVG